MTSPRVDIPRASELRAMGINSPGARDDRDLEDSVRLLVQLGLTLEELVDRDFGEAGTSSLLRPDATIEVPELAEPTADPDDFVNRLRVAVGMPQQKMALTANEVETARFFSELAAVLGEDQVISLLRVMGSSGSRIARAAVSMLRLQFETPINEQSGRLVDVLAGYVELIEVLLPRFLDANASILRTHFAHIVREQEVWSVDQSRSATLEPKVVGFADLVGFTAFTEKASAEEFMLAIVSFEESVQAAVIDNGGTLVKLIGDEVMFVAPTAISALAIAQELAAVGRRQAALKGMRVGLSSGEVINAAGDYYGSVVNIAARIVNLAFTNAIVVTAPVAQDLTGHVVTESLGTHDLRGISDPVELFRLRI